MRIVHIDTGREMRGGQWQALYLMEGLAAAGHQQLLLAPCNSPLYEAARSKGLDATPLRVMLLPRLCRSMDLVHAHDARAHTLGALIGHPRLVVSRRVAFPVQRNPLSVWKYGKARHYLAVSEFVKRELMAAGVEEGRITVVYDGVPIGDNASGGDWIVALASDDPMKGAALVRAAAARGGFEVRFSHCLAEDLRRAAVFVYITQREGLGSAVLMAMAAGVPVVASRIGGLTEVVEHEASGLLTENTPESIAAAVNRLRGDQRLAARLAATARRRVESHFSVEMMVTNTLRAYERVLA